MSINTILSQFKGLLVKTDQLRAKFGKVYPTENQWEALKNLSAEFSKLAKGVEDEIKALHESRTQRAWEESKELRSNAQSVRDELLTKGRLRNPPIFRRNILTIFDGPKCSRFDSEDVKLRKESTRRRCESIRALSPDGVISWSIAFAPTVWAGGSMATDVFTCLLDSVEPDLVQRWPSTVRETLNLLREDEQSLQDCPEYDRFLRAIDDGSRQPKGGGKRKRIEDGDAQDQAPPGHLIAPMDEHREMKHMYTNAPASNISKFPEPFRTFIQNSRLWQWERSQGLLGTGCWGTLFPKGDAQDVSLTIWGSHKGGYKLNEVFELQLTLSS